MIGTISYKDRTIENVHMAIHDGFDSDSVMVVSYYGDEGYKDFLVFHAPQLTMNESAIVICGFTPVMDSDDVDFRLEEGDKFEYAKLEFLI